MSIPIEELKDRLKFAMAKMNLRPIELADKTKIPKSSISQYMSGYSKPTSERVYLISKALNVSEAWLMGFDVPPNRNASDTLDLLSKSAISNKLKELRKSKNCTIFEVAEATGISEQVYNDCERGTCNPALKTLILLADFFNVTIDYLIGWDDETLRGLITTSEDPVIEKYNTLNTYGKHKVEAYIDGLMENPDYIDDNSTSAEKKRRTPTLKEAMEIQKPRPIRSDRLDDDGYERIAAYGRGVRERKKKK